MPKKSGLAQAFYIAGFDLSGDVGAMRSLSTPRTVMEVPGINRSAMERVMLRSDAEMEFMAFFNDAAGQEHPALSTLLTTNRNVIWALGQAIGDVAAMLRGPQINYDFTRNADGSLETVTRCRCDGVALEWGVMLTAADDTHASATSSASKDDAASSANGIAAMLHVISVGSGTFTVTIEHSTDNVVWATLVTFTGATGRTSQRLTASGTVNRYLRITSTGVFTNGVMVVAYRRGTAQDDEAYA